MTKSRIFDDLKKELDGQANSDTQNDWLVFETGETRTVDFQMLNGNRQNFNYSHHIKAWIGHENNETYIRVFFSTDTVTIKGYCLEKLYDAFRNLNVIIVRANDPRYYNDLNIDDTDPFVTDIIIEGHGKD